MTFLIYLLSFLSIFLACCVIFSRNPINSIIFLILTFVSLAFLLVTLNLKFIAFILIVLYAGAISILFLFIVLTLNIKNIDTKSVSNLSFFEKIMIFFILAKLNISLFFVFSSQPSFIENYFYSQKKIVLENYFYNTQLDLFFISLDLYNYYSLHFIVIGLTILVTMVGVVIITKNVIKN